jgi:hypothetical protein
MVIKEQCFNISEADPSIAEVRKIEKADPSLTAPTASLAGS